MDVETDQYLVYLGDGKRKEIMTYDAIVEAIDRQLTSETEKTDKELLWIFREIDGHRKNGWTWDVNMKWEDDSETWEPLAIIWKSDPVKLATYAKEHDLLKMDGWKRRHHYVKNKKKFKHQMKQVTINSLRHGPRIKFEVRIPKDHHEALEFDKKLGNTRWKEATKIEMDKTYKYKAFNSLGKGGRKSKDHIMIRAHLVYYVKQDERHKARLVAGGHMTVPNTNTNYSSVISLRAIRMMIFLAELNSMELIVANIGKEFQYY
eukprot:11136459-Ditylum_brightwellii.AAC.1